MTSRQRIPRAMRCDPVDRVACCPRMWKFARAYCGEYNAETILRCAEEFDYDPIYYTGAAVPNFLSGWMPSQDSMPEGLRFTRRTEPGGEGDVLHRRFETPAGPLTDMWHRPHPGKS